MSDKRTPEPDALQELRQEMNTWGLVHRRISDTLDAHTAMLKDIADAVRREPAGEDDPLVTLLRTLAGNSTAQTAALARIEAAITALTAELKAGR